MELLGQFQEGLGGMEEVSCAIQKGINELFVNGPVPEELTIKADAILPSQSIPSNCLCNCLRTYYGATNCFNTICVGATGNWCCQWDPNTTCCAKVNNKVVCAYGYECVASSYCCCFIEFTDGTRHCWNCGVETLNAGEWLIPGAIAETKLHLATSDSAYYTSNGGVNNVVCHVCNAGNLIRNPSTNSNFGTE